MSVVDKFQCRYKCLNIDAVSSQPEAMATLCFAVILLLCNSVLLSVHWQQPVLEHKLSYSISSVTVYIALYTSHVKILDNLFYSTSDCAGEIGHITIFIVRTVAL